MPIGKLDQRIVIQSLTSENVNGELIETYATLATVFAEVISERGSEAFEAARTNTKENIRVRIHYRTDVTTKCIITWEGQNYNIVATDRSGHRQGNLWFTAQAVGAE